MTDAPLANLRILIVDDNAHMRRLLQAVLSSFGCQRFAMADGTKAAIAELANGGIDIVITDLLMEPVDGLDLVRMIRDRERSPNPFLPIIMLTGASDLATVAQARDAGVTEFLAKPISTAALWRRLQTIIERPRPFVRAQCYFGPDRRRRPDAGYEGPERRDLSQSASGA